MSGLHLSSLKLFPFLISFPVDRCWIGECNVEVSHFRFLSRSILIVKQHSTDYTLCALFGLVSVLKCVLCESTKCWQGSGPVLPSSYLSTLLSVSLEVWWTALRVVSWNPTNQVLIYFHNVFFFWLCVFGLMCMCMHACVAAYVFVSLCACIDHSSHILSNTCLWKVHCESAHTEGQWMRKAEMVYMIFLTTYAVYLSHINVCSPVGSFPVTSTHIFQ
jgi:hypothetical protein